MECITTTGDRILCYMTPFDFNLQALVRVSYAADLRCVTVRRMLLRACLLTSSYWMLHVQDTAGDDDQGGASNKSLEASTLISPSIKLPLSFFSQLHQANKPVFSWVVDSPLQVRDALRKQVDGIISNDPLFLKLVVKSWWKRCRSAE